MLKGRCHCGAIRYEMPAEALHHALCHCGDPRRHAGAPVVACAVVPARQLRVDGEPAVHRSSEHGRRHSRRACGTGLFHVNESVLPGTVDVQTGTLGDPGALPARAHIQVAERIAWMATAHELPAFERYPPG